MVIPFMLQKSFNMTFFTDRCTQDIFFAGESVCFHSMDYHFESSM